MLKRLSSTKPMPDDPKPPGGKPQPNNSSDVHRDAILGDFDLGVPLEKQELPAQTEDANSIEETVRDFHYKKIASTPEPSISSSPPLTQSNSSNPTLESKAPISSGLLTELGEAIRDLSAEQKLFNRYILKKVLGRGGMGIVWLAQDEKLEREVALKFLPDIVKMDAAIIDDLKRETRKSLELTHPNIIRIYDFVDDETAAAISMEYVDGANLSKLRIEKPNRVFESIDLEVWLKQVCSALDYAHQECKIVHRDLKPGNLMLNSRGQIKVADFGIARSLSDSVSQMTQRATSSGTLPYMSPQQLLGEEAAITGDVYSLGATVYELLTSKPPFYSGDIPTQVLEKVPPSMKERREVLGIQGAEIPLLWEEIIAACLAKETDKRPQFAGEVLERLNITPPSTRHSVRATSTISVASLPSPAAIVLPDSFKPSALSIKKKPGDSTLAIPVTSEIAAQNSSSETPTLTAPLLKMGLSKASSQPKDSSTAHLASTIISPLVQQKEEPVKEKKLPINWKKLAVHVGLFLCFTYVLLENLVDPLFEGPFTILNDIIYQLGESLFVPGGTLIQIALPLILLFCTARHYFNGLCFSLGWIGTALFHFSKHISDARIMKLPPLLPFGNTAPVHEWHYILSTNNLLDQTKRVSDMMHYAAVTMIFLCLCLLSIGIWKALYPKKMSTS
jgi:serine/threonine protein kinase